MDESDLAGLVARVKSGDRDAVGDFLSRFEGELRIMARARLPRALRPQYDSMDFVQAVWESFFTGMRSDPDRFANVQDLRAFLGGVVRNKVREEHRRRTKTRKYDLNREEPLYVRKGGRVVPREVAGHEPTPSQDLQARDRLAQMLEGRTPQEAEIIQLRRGGMTFEEIAAKTGVNERAVRRVIEAVRLRMEARKWL